MSRKKLYLFVTLASVVGCLWVLFNVISPGGAHTPDLCIFKNITGIPCPSCGTTHAVLKLMHLDWKGAFYDNPLGYIIAAALLVLPAWMAYDYSQKKSSFFTFYKKTEAFIRRPWVAAMLILLVTANWMWSIYKFAA